MVNRFQKTKESYGFIGEKTKKNEDLALFRAEKNRPELQHIERIGKQILVPVVEKDTDYSTGTRSDDTLQAEESDAWGPSMLSPKDTTLLERFLGLKLADDHGLKSSAQECDDPDSEKDYHALREELQNDWEIWSICKRNEYHQDFIEWVESHRGAKGWKSIKNKMTRKNNPVTRWKVWNKAKKDYLVEIEREREEYFIKSVRDLEDRFMKGIRRDTMSGSRWRGVRRPAVKGDFLVPDFGSMGDLDISREDGR